MLTPAQHVAVAVIAFVGMGANAIAGGGMLMLLPALIGMGVPAVVANATATTALLPGTMASMLGYREPLRPARLWARHFLPVCIAGGALGGWLLTATSEQRFRAIVPWLVLVATVLFMGQRYVIEAIRRWTGSHPHDADPLAHPPRTAFLVFQFVVAIYGGYFGGGAGIVMLAAFGLMGLTDIHQMNGLKNVFAATFNVVAVVAFVAKGLVDWPLAATMAVGAISGGAVASRLAQRVPQRYVRSAIGVIGFGASIWLFASLRR
jgi:uncharacterized membrane protein YfcA